jgi:hypothetical protein
VIISFSFHCSLSYAHNLKSYFCQLSFAQIHQKGAAITFQIHLNNHHTALNGAQITLPTHLLNFFENMEIAQIHNQAARPTGDRTTFFTFHHAFFIQSQLFHKKVLASSATFSTLSFENIFLGSSFFIGSNKVVTFVSCFGSFFASSVSLIISDSLDNSVEKLVL